MKKNKKKKRQKIIGIKTAKLLEEKPHFIPQGGSTSQSQRQGHLYENRVAKYFKLLFEDATVLHGQWIEYIDRYGTGWCQPDIIIDSGAAPLVVVECKLTATKTAYKQLKGMYLPAVAKAFDIDRKDVRLVQVAKNMTIKFANEFMLKCIDDILGEGRWEMATLHLPRVPRFEG